MTLDLGGSQLGEEGLSRLGCSPDTPGHCSWLLTCFGESLTHSGLPPRLSTEQRWGGSGQPLLQPATEPAAGQAAGGLLVAGQGLSHGPFTAIRGGRSHRGNCTALCGPWRGGGFSRDISWEGGQQPSPMLGSKPWRPPALPGRELQTRGSSRPSSPMARGRPPDSDRAACSPRQPDPTHPQSTHSHLPRVYPGRRSSPRDPKAGKTAHPVRPKATLLR